VLPALKTRLWLVIGIFLVALREVRQWFSGGGLPELGRLTDDPHSTHVWFPPLYSPIGHRSMYARIAKSTGVGDGNATVETSQLTICICHAAWQLWPASIYDVLGLCLNI